MARLAGRRVRRFAVAVLLPLLGVAPLAAQSGSIQGHVRDSTGAPVAGAFLTVGQTALRVVTSSGGAFTLRGVPAGGQVLNARAIGFTPLSVQVTVVAGSVTRQDITLNRTAVVLAPIDVVLGSRARHAAAEELAVPVDVFPAEVIARQGTTETSQILQALAPSVNFPRQSIADADDIVRPFTLRGLSPDHALVLVNGLRRHRTALVHIFAYGMAAGSGGVDLNALPASAIGRIEVLRDGASAQYGSDAIAGVVNLVLKDGSFAPYLTTEAGQYLPRDYPNDGTTVDVNGGWGIKVGRGSLGLFAEYRHRNQTNRAWPDNTDQIVPGDADSVDGDGHVIVKRNPVSQPNFHWGDGLSKDLMTFANFRLPLSASGASEVYAFGGWSFRQGTGNGFRRTGLDSRNWPEIYPLGFLPTFDPDVHDVSGAGGLRGTLGGWGYDVGASYGRDGFKYNLTNTLNVSLGPCLDRPCAPGPDRILGTADDPGIANRTSIFAGQLEASEVSVTLNANRSLRLGLAQPVNVALGIAYRREYYRISRGEPASFIQGFHLDRDSVLAPAGSQVFAGFQPADEVDVSRGNFGAYVDLEASLGKTVLANLAGRFEDYSDFGSRVTAKAALRFQPVRPLILRAALSSGFRAPSLSQSYYSSRTTTFQLDTLTGRSRAIDFGIFPAGSAAAKALGAKPLRDETSLNLSGGMVVTPRANVSVTADAYYIHINHRIALSGLFDTDSVAAILANAGLSVGAAQYFTNGISTSTWGADVVANWIVPLVAGSLDLNLAANYTRNRIRSVEPLPRALAGTGVPRLIDPLTSVAIEKERPAWRSTLSGEYSFGRFHALARASSYGSFSSAQLGACQACEQRYGGKTLFDAELGYRFGQVNLSIGMRNIFDTFPDRASLDNGFGILPWPAASPYGYNGRYAYTRAEVTLR